MLGATWCRNVVAMSPRLGVCFDRESPAEFVVELAPELERRNVDQLWLIEDCFYTAAVSLAATALAATNRLTVGLGILPAVARNPAITAMELATLETLGPGRLVAGIGHGVQSWMEQIGARTPSPLTTLEEVLVAVTRLLDGESVTLHGRHVHLQDVKLDRHPTQRPQILAGVQRPRSLALAGRVADGVVLAEGAGPSYVRSALRHAGRADDPDGFRTVVFSALCVADDRAEARRIMAPFVAGLVEAMRPGVDAHPRIDEIRDAVNDGGPEALIDLSAEDWLEFGAIGTIDDAITHVEALGDAGATDVSVFVGASPRDVRERLDDIEHLAAALR